MRHVVLLLVAVIAALPSVCGAWEASPRRVQSVTLILKFEEPPADRVMAALNREISAILGQAGLKIESRYFSELAPHEQFQDLVVVQVKGRCKIDARPVARMAPGPLAFAHTSNGDVLPFMDVLCDQVRSAMRPVMYGDRLRQADEIFGRALARVVAHELYHILGRTCTHAETGIAQHSLSGEDLVSERLNFEPSELERIQTYAGS